MHAYRSVTAASAVRYRSGPGEAITLLLHDRPDLAGFTVTATAEPDPEPDISWLGEFTDTWPADAIEVNRHDRNCYRYFRPVDTITQRRADLARRGYAHGVAHELAVRGLRDDARLARDLESRVIRVEARKAGVLLGAAVMGTNVDPDAWLEDETAEVIHEDGLIDEAAGQARAALPALITALTA